MKTADRNNFAHYQVYNTATDQVVKRDLTYYDAYHLADTREEYMLMVNNDEKILQRHEMPEELYRDALALEGCYDDGFYDSVAPEGV